MHVLGSSTNEVICGLIKEPHYLSLDYGKIKKGIKKNNAGNEAVSSTTVLFISSISSKRSITNLD
jgi:hypothetical protein